MLLQFIPNSSAGLRASAGLSAELSCMLRKPLQQQQASQKETQACSGVTWRARQPGGKSLQWLQCVLVILAQCAKAGWGLHLQELRQNTQIVQMW